MYIICCTYRNTNSRKTVNPFRVIFILIFFTNTNNDVQHTGDDGGGGRGHLVGGVYSSDGSEVYAYGYILCINTQQYRPTFG
jgi:hypothetical protein